MIESENKEENKSDNKENMNNNNDAGLGSAGLNEYVVKGVKLPCVFYQEDFLGTDRGSKLFGFRSGHEWNINERTNRHTVLYGNSGVEYFYKDQPTNTVRDIFCFYLLFICNYRLFFNFI